MLKYDTSSFFVLLRILILLREVIESLFSEIVHRAFDILLLRLIFLLLQDIGTVI